MTAFMGHKAGMTHILRVVDRPGSSKYHAHYLYLISLDIKWFEFLDLFCCDGFSVAYLGFHFGRGSKYFLESEGICMQWVV